MSLYKNCVTTISGCIIFDKMDQKALNSLSWALCENGNLTFIDLNEAAQRRARSVRTSSVYALAKSSSLVPSIFIKHWEAFHLDEVDSIFCLVVSLILSIGTSCM